MLFTERSDRLGSSRAMLLFWTKWCDRVWQSLRADQDANRLVCDLHPIEDILDGSPSPISGTHLARLSVMDEIMFHTLEFAQIITGALGREIARYGDQSWSDR